jgi:predicted amidohydrolase
VKLGIIQSAPVFLDKQKSVQRILEFMREGADQSVDLVAFGETWLSGYPAWLDFCPGAGLWDNAEVKKVYAQTFESAVTIDSPEIAQVCELAAKTRQIVVLGINERVARGRGNRSLFNSIVTITADGNVANVHRKLVPTFTEKLVYSHGDGAGLQSVDTPHGRVGSLVCWEHWLPMARQAMHNSGEDIHFALWPWVHDKHQLACRHYAFEARCYVVGVGQIMTADVFPSGLQLPAGFDPSEPVLKGGSCVVQPNGEYLLPPDFETDGLICVDVEPRAMGIEEQMTLDVTGNYARWDVFDFNVNATRPD